MIKYTIFHNFKNFLAQGLQLCDCHEFLFNHTKLIRIHVFLVVSIHHGFLIQQNSSWTVQYLSQFVIRALSQIIYYNLTIGSVLSWHRVMRAHCGKITHIKQRPEKIIRNINIIIITNRKKKKNKYFLLLITWEIKPEMFIFN